jgi:hypothetical protein
MALGGMCYTNIARLATPTGVTVDTGYYAADTVDNRPSTVCRSTGTTFVVTWDLGAAMSIAAASVHNHNLPVGAVCNVEFAAAPFGAAAATETMTVTVADFYLVFAAPRSYRYVRFNVSGATSYAEIGEFCLWGTAHTFAKNWSYSYPVKRRINRYSSGGAQPMFNSTSRQSGFGLPFKNVASTELEYFVAAMEAGYILFVPDFAAATCYHGHIDNDLIDASRGYRDLDTLTLTFWQSAEPV